MKSLICLLLFALLNLASAEKTDVVLITIDTLRADRLGCYGYAGAQTPSIDRLAAEGILFTNTVSHVPLTRPSHTSIFTGLYPYQHEVHDNVSAPLSPKIPTLAQILKQNGYNTAAFVAAFIVNSQSGLDRGFDVYNDHFDPEKQPTQFALNLEKRGEEVYEEFAAWLKGKKSGPYFAWIHLYDPHYPYDPPPPYAQRFGKHPYDGEIAYTDHIVSKIIKLMGPKTLLILTSDHGESLGEHGENAHSFFIYDATLHVPLIFHWPGHLTAGRKIGMQTRLVDLFPTIFDLLGIKPRANIAGVSLKPWLISPQQAEQQFPSYCETFTPWLHFGWSRLQGVRADGWKYIEAPKPELYDVNKDPSENQNLIASGSTKSKELKGWLVQSGALNQKAIESEPAMDPETLEKLASLGYAGVTPPKAASNLPDPKDKIEDFKTFNKLIRDGIEAFSQEKYQEAVSSFRQLEERHIPSFEVHYYLGRSLLRLKSYDKARTELQEAIQILPHFLPAYRDLSDCWAELGRPDEAEKALLAGLTLSPDHPTLVQPLAWLYQQRKNYAAAERILLSEVKAHPDDLESRYRLGAIYRDTNRPEQAIEQYRQIVDRAPKDAEAHNQLGMIYGGSNQATKALAEFSEAARLDPSSEAIQRNLQIVKQRMRHSPEAKVHFLIIETKSLPAAESILRKLRAGEKWDTLARDYSLHPSARSNNPVIEAELAELDPAIASALAALKPGQISEPVASSSSFFILKRE